MPPDFFLVQHVFLLEILQKYHIILCQRCLKSNYHFAKQCCLYLIFFEQAAPPLVGHQLAIPSDKNADMWKQSYSSGGFPRIAFILFWGRFVAICPRILRNLWQLVQMYFEQCIHIFICLINAVTLRLIYISTTLIWSHIIPWLYQGRSPSAVCFPTRWCVCRKPCFLWGGGSYVFMLKKCESENWKWKKCQARRFFDLNCWSVPWR